MEEQPYVISVLRQFVERQGEYLPWRSVEACGELRDKGENILLDTEYSDVAGDELHILTGGIAALANAAPALLAEVERLRGIRDDAHNMAVASAEELAAGWADPALERVREIAQITEPE